MILMNLSIVMSLFTCVSLLFLLEPYLVLMMCLLGYNPSKIPTISGVLIATGVSYDSLLIALLYWPLLAAI